MSVRVNINTAQIAARIEGAAQRAVAITAEQMLADINNYVPQDQSVLINSSLIGTTLPQVTMRDTTKEEQKILDEAPGSDPENGKLVWSTPYARFLYHGVVMVDPKTGSPYARKRQTKVVLKPEKPLDFNKQNNPNAGSHWCERAYADHHEDWERIYQEALRKELENGGTG